MSHVANFEFVVPNLARPFDLLQKAQPIPYLPFVMSSSSMTHLPTVLVHSTLCFLKRHRSHSPLHRLMCFSSSCPPKPSCHSEDNSERISVFAGVAINVFRRCLVGVTDVSQQSSMPAGHNDYKASRSGSKTAVNGSSSCRCRRCCCCCCRCHCRCCCCCCCCLFLKNYVQNCFNMR